MDNSGEFDDKRIADSSRQMLNDTGKGTQLKPVSKTRVIIRYAIAAAATVLLIFLIIEGYKFYALSSKKLYTENFIPYELTTTHNATDSSRSKIEEAYREKKYAEVIKYNANSALSVRDVFLTGLSYLETNDMPRAISNFQVVIADVKENENSELKDAAEYYLALAYLQNNDYDQAIELMYSIHNDPFHQFKEKFSSRYIDRVKRLKWR